jgi:hypothetical protein
MNIDYPGILDSLPQVKYRTEDGSGKDCETYNLVFNEPVKKDPAQDNMYFVEKNNAKGKPNLAIEFSGCGYIEISWPDKDGWPKYKCYAKKEIQSKQTVDLVCDLSD